MKFLILMLMLPFVSQAEAIENFSIEKVGNNFFATPKKLTFFIEQLNKPRRDACFIGKVTLKNVSDDYIKYQCAQNSIHKPYCDSLVESVQRFSEQVYNDEFGPINSSFKIMLPSLDGITATIARELRTNVEQIQWFLPSVSKAENIWDIQRISSDGFYGRIAHVLSLSPRMSIKGGIIHIDDRFTYCQVLEDSFLFSTVSSAKKEIRIPRPISEVKALKSLYQGVRSDWEESDQATQWKNSIHPLFTIGKIIKAHLNSSSVKSIYSLEELYDRMFQHYIIDNEFSVYIKHFKNDDDFEMNVHPGILHSLSASTEYSNY